MPETLGRPSWRRARTAAALPGRVVGVEDRISALERHVSTKIDEMRGELAEIRSMLRTQLEADADATELLGRLLQANEERLSLLERELGSGIAETSPVPDEGPATGER